MKKWKISLLFMTMSLLILSKNESQTIVRYFYAPSDAIDRNFTGAAAAYIERDSCFDDQPSGYSRVIVDKITIAAFNLVAPKYIKLTNDQLTNPKSDLRKRLLQLKDLSNGLVSQVDVSYYDDRLGRPNKHCNITRPGEGEIKGVWPNAINYKYTNTDFGGNLELGELAAIEISDTGKLMGYWWSTILHEFSHTQFNEEHDANDSIVANKLGRDGVSLSYGGDEGHWGSELMGTEQSALDEGLASFWGLEINPPEIDDLIDFLNSKEERFLLGSQSVLSGWPGIWNAPHQTLYNGTIPANKTIMIKDGTDELKAELIGDRFPAGAHYQLRKYKWLDIPGEFIFYNEQMFEGYVQLYHEFAYAVKDTAFNKIYLAARAMTPPFTRLRYPALFANHLAGTMEKYASTKKGQKDLADGQLISSMFAYALYDIITHFSIPEADLKRKFTVFMKSYVPVDVPKAFSAYWAQRDAVKNVTCPFLGNNDCKSGKGDIDIRKAVEAARNFFKDPAMILK